MSETWFTADCNFGHQRIIELCNRPFASVEEMDETIVVKLHDGSVTFDHYPLRGHFYGHVHGTLPPLGRSLDVGVDAHTFAPIHSSEAVRMAISHDPGIDYDPKAVSWSPPVSISPVS